MICRGLIALTLVFGLALAAGAGDDAKKDQDAMQGIWTVSKIVLNGKAALDDIAKKIVVAVEGDMLSMRFDLNIIADGKFKLDPAKTPKQIDMTSQSGPDKGQVRLGIYELKDGKLTLHFLPGTEAVKTRPANFDGDVVVLQREKK